MGSVMNSIATAIVEEGDVLAVVVDGAIREVADALVVAELAHAVLLCRSAAAGSVLAVYLSLAAHNQVPPVVLAGVGEEDQGLMHEARSG